MNDQAPPPEEIGTVAEEAAKLFSVLQDWAVDQGAQQGDAASSAASSAAGSAAAGVAAGLRDLNEHLATGGADCAYCPVCQVIHKVRETSPEVRAHLTSAASSLLQAGLGLLEAHGSAPPPPRPSGVQRIDLDEDGTGPDEDA